MTQAHRHTIAKNEEKGRLGGDGSSGEMSKCRDRNKSSHVGTHLLRQMIEKVLAVWGRTKKFIVSMKKSFREILTVSTENKSTFQIINMRYFAL